MTKQFRYTDYGNFIQMDKADWEIIKKYLRDHGQQVTEKNAATRPICQGTNSAGHNCRLYALPGQRYCRFHGGLE